MPSKTSETSVVATPADSPTASGKAALRSLRQAKKTARRSALKINGQDNQVRHGRRVQLAGYIEGDGNRIEIADVGEACNLRLEICGNNNLVRIAANATIRGLTVHIGSHIPAHGTSIEIGCNFSISRGGEFHLYNSGNRLCFGDDCLLSFNTVVRCGEIPHLIFDHETGAYLDVTEPVVIGNHVWIGEDVYLGKRAGLADDMIVAARSVVTKRFEQSHSAIGGNPARIIRRAVSWVRNPGLLVPGTPEHASFHAAQARLEALGKAGRSPADLPQGNPAAR